MLMTTTNELNGYHVEKYLGVISKDIVFRSGLGKAFSAALTNFVASLSLKDVELSGSSDLIANAKDYVMQRFEQQARIKGANAIIGVDVETSFGEELARVAISGTAVVVKPIDSSAVVGDDEAFSPSVISISKTNPTEQFVPVELSVSTKYDYVETVLFLQSFDETAPSDIMADLTFTSIFQDTHSIENVCFLGFKKQGFKYQSNPVRIRLPEQIAQCIETCSIRIRKYRKDEQLIEPKDLDMCAVEELISALKKSIEVENKDIFGWFLDETPGYIRCPNCNTRASSDYMKYKKACISCGFPRKA